MKEDTNLGCLYPKFGTQAINFNKNNFIFIKIILINNIILIILVINKLNIKKSTQKDLIIFNLY